MGDPKRFQDEYNFFEIAIGNIATLNEYDFENQTHIASYN